jgi:hypothetical protein
MSIDRTLLLHAVEPILAHLHGYGPHELAALHAIAARENQSLRQELAEKQTPMDSFKWKKTWCFAGAERLGFDKGLSTSAVKRAIARAKLDGLLKVKRRGANRSAFRCVNEEALETLRRSSSADALYCKYQAGGVEPASPIWDGKNRRAIGINWQPYLVDKDVEDQDRFDFSPLFENGEETEEELSCPSLFELEMLVRWISVHRAGQYQLRRSIARGEDGERVPMLRISRPRSTSEELVETGS